VTISRVGPVGTARPPAAAARSEARSQEESEAALVQLLAADRERTRLFLALLAGDQQNARRFLRLLSGGGTPVARRRRARRRIEGAPRDPELAALREGELT
jgi:hypothetical protein